MKTKFKYLISIVVFSIFFSFCAQKKSSIFEVVALRKIDTTDGRISRFDLFLVRDYDSDENVKNQIDAIIQEYNKDKTDTFYQYDMTFYKESDITTPSKLIENPKLLYRYSQDHDLIYNFSWMKGKLVSKMKFENGKAVDY